MNTDAPAVSCTATGYCAVVATYLNTSAHFNAMAATTPSH